MVHSMGMAKIDNRTGEVEEVMCVFCPATTEVHGVPGKPLDIDKVDEPPWDERLSRDILQNFRATGSLFVVQRSDNGTGQHYSLILHPLTSSPSIYGAGYFNVPYFGFDHDEVIWVCPHCTKYVGRDPEAVSNLLREKCAMYLEHVHGRFSC